MQPRVSLLFSLWEGQDGQVPFEFSSGPSNILHFITTESKSRSIKSKKGTRPISSHLELGSSIKDLLNAPLYKDNFFRAGPTREIPSRKVRHILVRARSLADSAILVAANRCWTVKHTIN